MNMDYVLYRDHSGLIIATKDDYDDLMKINVALRARTWGEFLDGLPPWEREEILELEDINFGPGLRSARAIDPDDPSDDTPIERDSPFDSTLIPGFCDGDWPSWPAEEFSLSDEVCEEAFRLFGHRSEGFIQTFWNIRDEAVDDLRHWLERDGHTLLDRT